MTVQDIINEIRMKEDLSHIDDDELLVYIDDLDRILCETYFPKFASEVLVEDDPGEYPVTEIHSEDQIKKLYIDGNKAVKKSIANDLLDGWYFSGNKVLISPGLLGENSEVVLMYRVDNTPHEYEDTEFAVPESFHDLYVLYALAEIASKEADTASYENYKREFNALLADAFNALNSGKAYPETRLTQ